MLSRLIPALTLESSRLIITRRLIAASSSVVPSSSGRSPSRNLFHTSTPSRVASRSTAESKPQQSQQTQQQQQKQPNDESNVDVNVSNTGNRSLRRRHRGRSSLHDEDEDMTVMQRRDDNTDMQQEFDEFRDGVNRLLMEFDDSIGGGFLSDRFKSPK